MRCLIALAGGMAAAAAEAAPPEVKPLLDARLRYEHVEQDGLPKDSEALTDRLRAGLQATAGRWTLLVEGEGTAALSERYNDGLNGRTAYPLIVDPHNLELNRAQLRYVLAGGAGTAGRQRIELLDQRFVGSAGFRQNEQTFDGARMQWGRKEGLSADISYVWSVRTVNGSRGTGARQQAVSGDNLFAVIAHPTRLGTLSGFAFVVDQDEAAVQGYRLSSRTLGVRLAGTRPLSSAVKLSYALSWARQADHHRNPNDYAANYALAEASLATGGLAVTGGYEVLGADGGTALTSFQTPLASLFKFQGSADRFTITPPNGLRDLYGTIAYAPKTLGPLRAVNLPATYHRFDSDRLNQHYGDEWDLLAAGRIGRTLLAVRYAHYTARSFAADMGRLWLSAEWSL